MIAAVPRSYAAPRSAPEQKRHLGLGEEPGGLCVICQQREGSNPGRKHGDRAGVEPETSDEPARRGPGSVGLSRCRTSRCRAIRRRRFVEHGIGHAVTQPEQDGEHEDARNDEHAEGEGVVAGAPTQDRGEQEWAQHGTGLVESLMHAERGAPTSALGRIGEERVLGG